MQNPNTDHDLRKEVFIGKAFGCTYMTKVMVGVLWQQTILLFHDGHIEVSDEVWRQINQQPDISLAVGAHCVGNFSRNDKLAQIVGVMQIASVLSGSGQADVGTYIKACKRDNLESFKYVTNPLSPNTSLYIMFITPINSDVEIY